MQQVIPTFAKYEIIDEIGRGGMGIVYKARQKNLDRLVAIKAIPTEFLNDTRFIERFHREARSAAKASHPHIVTIYDDGIENGIHFIAMEFVEGADLNKIIVGRGLLSVEESSQIIAQIAEALQYAHSKGLVHRDIKSSNILVTPQGRAVLTDFGIAHAAAGTPLTKTGAVLGTPDFMSPEQISGKKLDGRTDIYSLGVVLYQALTGALPHTADNTVTAIYKIMHEPPQPIRQLRDVPKWVEHVIDGCLEKDPERRIQSGNQLAELLRGQEIWKPGPLRETTETVRIDTKELNRIGVQKSSSRRTPWKQATKRWLLIGVTALSIATAGVILYKLFLTPGSDTGVGAKTQQQQQSAIGGYVTVPDLKGLSVDDAKRSLAGARLQLGTINKMSSSSENRDRVVGQFPKKSTQVDVNTPINLFIGE